MEKTKEGMVTKEEAAYKAIDYCIAHNVLVDFFKERRNEVVGMILDYTAEQAERDFAKLEHEINEKEQRIEGMHQDLAEKEQCIENMNQALAEKDLIIAKLLEENAKLKEK